ncbi:P-loop NTPase family protein [Vibrio ishigakensis]|uniref:hypothetical protein n=1 Tax=Vibrio ishigakensis TaxID=1481914 RepID=UPI0021C3B9C3|nr:hypothetical protein [Vibrio ishigakensis]
MIKFVVLDKNVHLPSSSISTAYLQVDYWNDYSFITMFYMTVFDQNGTSHDIGNVKIAFKGQTISTSTYSTLGKNFSTLTEKYFSVGTNVEYYKSLNKLDGALKKYILNSLQDIVHLPNRLPDIEDESVLNISLFRGVSLSEVHGQFARVLEGFAELSDFDFNFIRNGVDGFCDLKIPFEVTVNSAPSTNIHAFIGRNGCGKTTILNDMIEAITKPDNENIFLPRATILMNPGFQLVIFAL